MKEKIEGEVMEEEAVTVDPEAVILGILSEILTSGASDSESSAINGILEEYRAGKCSGEEAIQKVRDIEKGRQSYH